ncbi:MAG TPA: hypothetical protein VNC84_04260 [Gammaproteobacteria bacterium]|jgi:hypothetical protein|nr:hypothetical protein [Gammaproteobacteria bacterium]
MTHYFGFLLITMKIEKFFNIRTLAPIATVCAVAYYLLLRDNFLHTSIGSIVQNSHHFKIIAHLIILGLLPIYIGTMLFGAAMVGIYVGNSVDTRTRVKK